RNRERRAEQAPDARAIPVGGPRIVRLDVSERQRRPAAGRHPGERAAHVGDGVGQRHGVTPAAGEEAAAGEVLRHGAVGELHRAAVAAPYTGGEAQLARLRAEAAAARKGRGGRDRRRRGRDDRRGRGDGSRGGGRRRGRDDGGGRGGGGRGGGRRRRLCRGGRCGGRGRGVGWWARGRGGGL